MEIITLLIFISLLIAVGFLIAFLWNMKSGQYDDTYSPSVRMLFDDKPKAFKPTNTKPTDGAGEKKAGNGHSDLEKSKGKSVS
jgi:cbb3-type cytochrome oxidase maturation protein